LTLPVSKERLEDAAIPALLEPSRNWQVQDQIGVLDEHLSEKESVYDQLRNEGMTMLLGAHLLYFRFPMCENKLGTAFGSQWLLAGPPGPPSRPVPAAPGQLE
jgi:hypothetical protein